MHWRLLYNWYSELEASVNWQGQVSPTFPVTKGTRQGNLLSPYFIDDLLVNLFNLKHGVWTF